MGKSEQEVGNDAPEGLVHNSLADEHDEWFPKDGGSKII